MTHAQPQPASPSPHEVSVETASFLSDAHVAAGAVYFKGQPAGQKQLPAGWQRGELPSGAPGLAAAMQKADCELLRAPSGRLLVAFRGTAQASDWAANAANGVGLYSAKYAAAAEIGRAFRDADPPVAFTGHSLGGGLAKLAGEAASKDSDSKTVVAFNGAPVSPQTYRLHDLPARDHRRTTIHVVNEHDILNRAIKGGKISAIGGSALTGREHEPNSMIVLAKGSGSAVGASGHGIRNFVPMGDASNAEHFTSPLFRGDGAGVEASAYDRYAPRMPEAGRTAAILEAARPHAGVEVERAHQIGHGR